MYREVGQGFLVAADLRRAQQGRQAQVQVFGFHIADGDDVFAQQVIRLIFALLRLGLVGSFEPRHAALQELLECRAVGVLRSVAARPSFRQRGEVGMDIADGGLPKAD